MKIKNATKSVKRLDFELTAVKLSKKDATGECIIEGMANTVNKDRVGDVVQKEAFIKTLPMYMKNPVILANHDWNEPCGVCLSAEVVENGLFIRARISDTREDIKTLIREGCLRTFSIGYNEIDADYDESTKTKYIKELELLEISVVTVPANTEAMFTQATAKVDAPAEEAKDDKPQGKSAKVKTAKELKDYITGVKSAVDRDLNGNEVIAICEYFNENEEIMTIKELIALLKTKSVDAAAAPAADAAKADAAKPADAAAPADASGGDAMKQILAKLDAIAQGMAQILEGMQEDAAEDSAEDNADKPKDEAKPEDKPADEGKADAAKPADDGKDDDKDKEQEEKDLDLSEVNSEIASLEAEIAALEDSENA